MDESYQCFTFFADRITFFQTKSIADVIPPGKRHDKGIAGQLLVLKRDDSLNAYFFLYGVSDIEK